MKKCLLLLLTIGLAALSLFGCTTPDVPGSAWAQKEILVYDVLKKTDGENGIPFATAVSTLERVTGQVAMKNVAGKEYTIPSNGTHFSMVTTDTDGNVIMESEFIMGDFNPVASYKTVKYGDKDYSYSGEYVSGKFVYNFTDNKNPSNSVTGASIKTSGTYMDNEFIYMYIRCYALENINKAITLLTPPDGGSTDVVVKAVAEGSTDLLLPGKTEKEKVDISGVSINRATTPSGSGIYVTYTKYNDDTDAGNFGLKTSKNYHIPILIVENDITYKIKDGDNIQIFTSK